MKIAIHCTGGTKLGYGHFFRSKTFVKARPVTVKVLLLPIVEREDSHFFSDVIELTTLCEDENSVLEALFKFQPDCIVYDTVFSSDYLFNEAKKIARITASISPVFNQQAGVDYLFTRNSNTPSLPNVTIFKGFEFAIFNEHCQFIPDALYMHNLQREFLTVGLAMGGGDAPNKTLQILKSVAAIESPCTFWVLLGEGYRHSYQELVNSIRRDSNHEIILAKTNRSMWNIFSNCSVAILAGGLTAFEAAHAGLPTLNIYEKEDHLVAAGTELFELGIAEKVGLFNNMSLEHLSDRLKYFIQNKMELLKMRNNSKDKIDKLGPDRIYRILREIV